MSLLDHEKSALAKKVGSTASIIITSVVRFYLASPNPKAKKNDPNSVIKNFPDISDRQWKFTNVVGALVLLVDRTLDTFLFRIYDLEGDHELRFEYELYEDIEYKALDAQFHAFEMDDCVGGFSFASKDEAPKFLSKVNALKPTSKGGAVDALKGKKKPAASGGGGLFGKKPKPKPVMEVSAVINVTHTQHVGVGADGGFDLNNISPEWKALFKQAGIRKKDLANPETAKAIADTIIRSQPVEQHAQLKAQMAPPATTARAATPAAAAQQAPAQQQQQQQQTVLDPLAMDLEQAKQVYTPEQVRELEAYREAMRKYEEEMAAYEAEQAALAAWERDNKKLIAEKEAKALADEQERVRREKQAKELAEKKRIAKDLADLQAQQASLEAQLKEKDRIMAEKNAEQEKMLKEAGSKGVAPAPPPRKVVVTISEEAAYVPPPVPAMVVEDLPPLPVRRNSRSKSVVQKMVEVVKGPSPEEIAAERAAEEEERHQRAELLRQRQLEANRQEEEFTQREEELRKKRAEDRARALQEEESNWKEERERIRREMENTIRAEEAEIYKRAEAERLRMQQEAAEEQTRIQQQINQAKSQAEKQRAEEMFRLAALESERARAEQEARELRAAEEREQARLAAEQAQREQEEVLLQLQIMQMKTAEAKRLVEQEERRQEELRKEAAKKKAPPIPARLPERPPLPPPPASAPRPPPPPPAMAGGAFKPEAGGRPPMPPGGISGVLNGLGGVQLKKTENIADKSGPNVTGKMGRDAQKNAFLGALEKGVQLKKADGSKASVTNAAQKAQLPKLTQQNDQAGLMASLIATMGARRGALNGDSDEDEDDWSD